MIKEHPGFIDQEKRWPSIEPRIEPVKQIAERWRDRRRPPHQAFHLEADDFGKFERFLFSVEEASMRAVDGEGLQRITEIGALQQKREAGEGSLARRRGAE